MPKLVDHDARRAEIVATAWRVIARRGLRRTTLLDVATEAGFANGALKPYFPSKDALLSDTFQYVYERTNARIEIATRGLAGREALAAFADEVLPLSDDAVDEARVVLEFWGAAVHTPQLAHVNTLAMSAWRSQIERWLEDERVAGQWTSATTPGGAARAILSHLLGAQIAATIDEPLEDRATELRDQFGGLLAAWIGPRLVDDRSLARGYS